MKRILIDTNFFLTPFQLGVNIFSELERVVDEPFELFTLSPLKCELEKLAKSGKGADKSAAQLAIQLARGISVEDWPEGGDAGILSYVKKKKDVTVATNDSNLRKALKSMKIPTIFVRNNSKLEME